VWSLAAAARVRIAGESPEPADPAAASRLRMVSVGIFFCSLLLTPTASSSASSVLVAFLLCEAFFLGSCFDMPAS
jgi:hypothetical protein